MNDTALLLVVFGSLIGLLILWRSPAQERDAWTDPMELRKLTINDE